MEAVSAGRYEKAISLGGSTDMTNGRKARPPIRIPLTARLSAALAAYREALARRERSSGPTHSVVPRDRREEEIGHVAGRRLPCPRNQK